MDKGKYSLYQPDTTNLYIVKAVKNKITLKVFTVIKTYIIVWYYYILFSLLIFFIVMVAVVSWKNNGL